MGSPGSMGKQVPASPPLPEIETGAPGMKVKLSDAVARTGALDGKQELTLWDTDLTGFGLRMKRTAKGVSKRWSIQYRNALRKTTWFIIADVNEMGAAEARKIAAKTLAGIRLGTYPEAEKKKRRREAEQQHPESGRPAGQPEPPGQHEQQQAAGRGDRDHHHPHLRGEQVRR